jgi:hypothetical protein
MANTIGRVIRRVAAGAASTSNQFADLRPLGSGAAQIWLTSDLNHLGDESTYRQLASVPGFGVGGVSIARNSPTAATIAVPSQPSDFDWFSPAMYTPFVEYPAASICFGTHPIHRVARDAATWPRLVLRCRVDTPTTSGDKMYACLVAAPGPNTGAASITEAPLFVVGSATGGAGWVDFTLTLPLTVSSLATLAVRPELGATATGVSGDSEMVVATVTTVWASFLTTEVGGKAAQAVGITLALEPA